MNERFTHKKSLGQNFLNSDYVPKQMCDAADLKAGDKVLEIGPGTGALTRELLSRGVEVLALEADPRAIATLQENFASAIGEGKLRVIKHDVRQLDPGQFDFLQPTYKVVSNIPYYLSGILFRSLLDTDHQPDTLVFLIQKEVAERIARDKKESLLSLSIKVFGEPTYVSTIKKSHFTPPPKIDSAIVAVKQINRDKLQNISSEQFFRILKLGFGQKRKQLLGNLAADFDRNELENTFAKLNIPTNVRAEDVQLDTWLKLTNHLPK